VHGKPHFHDPVTGEILLKHKIEWRALLVQNLSSISRVQQKVRRGEGERKRGEEGEGREKKEGRERKIRTSTTQSLARSC
jgi:hypothetical protein